MITALFVTIIAAVSYYVGNRRAYKYTRRNTNAWIKREYGFMDREWRRRMANDILKKERPLI